MIEHSAGGKNQNRFLQYASKTSFIIDVYVHILQYRYDFIHVKAYVIFLKAYVIDYTYCTYRSLLLSLFRDANSLAALISWAVTAYFDGYVYREINSVIATKSIILIVRILNIQTYLNK